MRLAKATEQVATRLEALPEPANADYVPRVRDLAKALIDFLDGLDADPDLEPTLGYVPGEAANDECESEPDLEPPLGSFDGMMNQAGGWKAGENYMVGSDIELDNCDEEPSLGSIEAHP